MKDADAGPSGSLKKGISAVFFSFSLSVVKQICGIQSVCWFVCDQMMA